MDRPLPSQVKVEFEKCAECEYDGGFHVVLLRRPPGPETTNPAGVLLRCPNCRHTYDVGWVVELSH